MDTLENNDLAVEKVQQEVSADVAMVNDSTPVEGKEKEQKAGMSRADIVSAFQALLAKETSDIRDEVEQLKNQFYRLTRQEIAEVAVVEDGSQAVEPMAPDALEEQFRGLLASYKQRRAMEIQQKEETLKQNQQQKEAIIDQLRQFTEQDSADVVGNIQKVKELQQEWKSIGKIPATEETLLSKQYVALLEKFYDLLHINNELREYDFKKNLEVKTSLCEQAEALDLNENVVDALAQLQRLHEEWKTTGPVAREVREQIWERFKAASLVINKKHQDYFTALHAREEENRLKKEALLECLRQVDVASLTTSKLWDEAVNSVNAVQQEWRAIGFAPKKVNTALYEEYRRLCDAFFTARSAFYQQLREAVSNNLEKRKALAAQAEALKDSQAWKETTDKLVQLQKEWKDLGSVGRRQAEELWQQFSSACDYFFAQKKAATQGQRDMENENLQKKQAIVAAIEALDITTKNETLDKLHALIAQYNAIGFVPFKEKDKLYKRFRQSADRIFETLQVEAQNRRLDAFSREVENKDENSLMGDRRLLRQYETLQNEIKTAENNILFFSGNSKKGNKLVDDMEKKIQQQKKQLSELMHRIQLIDKKLE